MISISSKKVSLVVTVVLSLFLLLLLVPESSHATLQPRRRRIRFPSRSSYSSHPLSGLLPRGPDVYYMGFDSTGFSRNGRDLRHIADVEN